MRGTPVKGIFESGVTGIIPAYAGNTSSTGGYRKLAWDHPRVCGEHKDVQEFFPSYEGSSPRMRGTPEFIQS